MSSFLLPGAQRGSAGLPGQHLALADPHLAPDGAVGGPGDGVAVVDVCAQRVQRHPAFAVPLVARHLRAAQAPGAGHADPLGSELHPGLDRLLHRPAKGDPPLQLGGDVLRHQLRVRLRLADFDDVQEDLVLGELLQVLFDRLDAGAALADDDAWASGVHVHLHLVRGALDLHLGDTGVAERLLHELADADVLVQPLGVVLVLEPLRVPRLDDAEAEPDRMNFLAQRLTPSSLSPPQGGARLSPYFRFASASTTWTWLDFLLIRVARPIARGMYRR